MNNRGVRQQLEAKYGKGCMFKKCHAKEQIEALHTIKTYKIFLATTRYSGKKIRQLEANMTLHHLRHRSEGGKTDEENGAIVSEMAHRYIHSLPRDQEEVVNNMLRRFKMTGGLLVPTETGIEILDPQGIELELDLQDCITIPAYDTTREDYRRREKFKRQQMKKETQELIDECFENLNDEEILR